MKISKKFKQIIDFIKSQDTPSEDEFREKTLMTLIPILILIFITIAWLVFPFEYGFFNQKYFASKNVRMIHALLIVLSITYAIGKKTGPKYIMWVLPVFLSFMSYKSFLDPKILEQTPYIPYYTGIVSIVFGLTFLCFKALLIHLVVYIPIAVTLGSFTDFATSELLHRFTIILVLTPFAIVFAAARKVIFKELKNNSDELLEMSNIQILAELAGGVAHEINNPLAIISGIAASTRRSIAKNECSLEIVTEEMQQIEKTVFRISKITNSLLDIAHKRDKNKFEVINLGSIISDSISIFEEVAKQKGIKLDINKPSYTVKLECIPVQIMQVIVNLISNAIDAVKGTPNPWISIECFMFKDKVTIHFSDSGSGIPEDIAEKVMLPFFTTKSASKGTGLGLSICQRVATTHNGEFKLLTDKPNTTFEFTIPLEQH